MANLASLTKANVEYIAEVSFQIPLEDGSFLTFTFRNPSKAGVRAMEKMVALWNAAEKGT